MNKTQAVKSIAYNNPTQYLYELIKNQKAICKQLITQYERALIDRQHNNRQIQHYVKELILGYYEPIKKAYNQNKIQKPQFQSYLYLFNKTKLKNVFKNTALDQTAHRNRKRSLCQQQSLAISDLIYQGQQGENSQNLCCLVNLPPAGQKLKINPLAKHYRVYAIPEMDFKKSNQAKQSLKKYICSMLNGRQSILFIGVKQIQNKQYVVTGIQLQNSQMYQIKDFILQIRKSNIFPQHNVKQQIEVNFLQFNQNNCNNSQSKQSAKAMQGVLKIYINSWGLNQTYFVKQKSLKTHDYEFKLYRQSGDYKYATKQKIYKIIHENYRLQQENHPHKNIKCVQRQIKQVLTTEKTEPVMQKKQQKIDISLFGEKPEKYFQNQSIVIVQTGAQKSAKQLQLLRSLEKQSGSYKIYQLFQKLIKHGQRIVYYMTHRKNFQEMRRIIIAIDSTKKALVHMKIKPNIELLKQQYFQQAYETLKRYENCFSHELQVRRKRAQKNAQQFKYIFCFKEEVQVIFAFTLLENANIKSNFVSNKKIEDSQKYQIHGYGQDIDK